VALRGLAVLRLRTAAGKLAIELRLLLQHPGLRALQGAGGLRRLGARPRRHDAALGARG
jgi:hypothetical protein